MYQDSALKIRSLFLWFWTLVSIHSTDLLRRTTSSADARYPAESKSTQVLNTVFVINQRLLSNCFLLWVFSIPLHHFAKRKNHYSIFWKRENSCSNDFTYIGLMQCAFLFFRGISCIRSSCSGLSPSLHSDSQTVKWYRRSVSQVHSWFYGNAWNQQETGTERK